MRSLLYIEVAEYPGVSYDKPLLRSLSEGLEDVVVFDIDNRSDGETTNIAQELIKKSQKVILYIHFVNEGPLEKATSLIRVALNTKAKVLWILNGQNGDFDKYRHLLDKNKVVDNQSIEDIKQKILEFLSN